jgi:hypothetical protein
MNTGEYKILTVDELLDCHPCTVMCIKALTASEDRTFVYHTMFLKSDHVNLPFIM